MKDETLLQSREHFISLCNKFWNWQEHDEITAGEEPPMLEWNGQEFTHRVTKALWRMYHAALQSGNSAQPVTVPAGYVLVPVEPTPEMCDVGHIGIDVLTGVTSDSEYYSTWGDSAAKLYRAMLAAAPTAPDGWIPVSERMPDHCNGVWAWSEAGDGYSVEAYFDGSWYRTLTDEPVYRITHWQPLPDAPKGV